jgi:translation elongation factor EF-1beta
MTSHSFTPEQFECSPSEAASKFSMQKSRLIAGSKSVFRTLVAFGLGMLVPSLYAQQNKAGSDSPQAAWSNIQQFVKDMETAVQSKNLHGIHEPSMKIRAPIKTLKQHSSMLSGDKGQKIAAALKQLDTSVTDLHSASDEGSQADAETALKAVESALDQLKAQAPETAFKSMH